MGSIGRQDRGRIRDEPLEHRRGVHWREHQLVDLGLGENEVLLQDDALDEALTRPGRPDGPQAGCGAAPVNGLATDCLAVPAIDG